jgi:hypothetical protein
MALSTSRTPACGEGHRPQNVLRHTSTTGCHTSKSRPLRCALCLYRFVASMITVGRSKGSLNIVSWPLSTLVRSWWSVRLAETHAKRSAPGGQYRPWTLYATCSGFHRLFRRGLASKPWLWPGPRRLWLFQTLGQAKTANQGLARPRPRLLYVKTRQGSHS